MAFIRSKVGFLAFLVYFPASDDAEREKKKIFLLLKRILTMKKFKKIEKKINL